MRKSPPESGASVCVVVVVTRCILAFRSVLRSFVPQNDLMFFLTRQASTGWSTYDVHQTHVRTRGSNFHSRTRRVTRNCRRSAFSPRTLVIRHSITRTFMEISFSYPIIEPRNRTPPRRRRFDSGLRSSVSVNCVLFCANDSTVACHMEIVVRQNFERT